MFVGRTEELAFLEQQYERRQSAFVPVYGRRRVGKSALLRQFVERRPALYHVGRTAPPHLLVGDFLRQLARLLDDPIVAELPTDDWRRPLELLDRFDRTRKLVLVLDEFQWTAGASPGLPGLLQELWDTRWSRSGRIVLVLCGSYVGFMEREVLGKKAPLFGRRTGQILLGPLGHRTAAEFHPKWSLEHRAQAHFICGGVPAYLELLDDHQSLEMNLRELVFTELGPLRREPDFLLREELRDVERYYAILLAVASGKYGVGDIERHAGIGRGGGVHYYIKQLMDLGYLERHVPLSDVRPPRTEVRYRLSDPLLRFWFRFVFPNESFLEQAGAKETWKQLVAPNLSAYFGACFERLSRAALPSLYEREGVATGYRVGEYWSRKTQIDVVGLREDGWTDLGECKWGSVRSAGQLESELEAKARYFPNERGATLGLRAFVRRKPKSRSQKLVWHDLEDLYQ